jgi:hypothetical protein
MRALGHAWLRFTAAMSKVRANVLGAPNERIQRSLGVRECVSRCARFRRLDRCCDRFSGGTSLSRVELDD